MLRRSFPLLAAALLATTALAFQNEPDGFSGARFGMSIEQVKEVFPALKEFGASPDGVVAMYTAEGLSFDGLEACKVTLGFVANKLYEIRFDCGSDESVAAILRAKFGSPSVVEEKLTIWRGETAVVSMNRQVKTFAFASPALTKVAHQYFLQRAITEAQGARESHAQGEVKQDEPSSAQEPAAAP